MYQPYINAIDTSYSEGIMDELSRFGDDPATGNRSAGSPSCTKAAEYLYQKFREIGLNEVTMDSYAVNGWTYKGANLIYRDEWGTPQKVVLGGYATQFYADEEGYPLVFGGKGTLEELEELGDITNKLVLIAPLNPMKDNWVSFPAYQAYVKRAAGVLVAAVHDVILEDALISNDVSVPPYCKALAISMGDAQRLRDLIASSPDNEIQVVLSANSTVHPNVKSYNVWGEIPGESQEVLYLIAHYDGYYHSLFDDASGVSEILGIAKALIDSGYRNNRTIRVVAHGAEEWGNGYSALDWAAGAYQQIINLHPNWAEQAFALINIDGNFPVEGERSFVIYTSPELYGYVDSVASEILSDNADYRFEIRQPVPLLFEDFIYQRVGIPAITAGDDFNKSLYYRAYYHSSLDNASTGFDRNTHQLIQQLYGSILIHLDHTPVRPMDFSLRFKELRKSFNPSLIGEDMQESLDRLLYLSTLLTDRIRSLNSHGEIGRDFSERLNQALFRLYQRIQDAFLAISYTLEPVYPHSLPQKNTHLLFNAIEGLESGSLPVEAILSRYLLAIDMNYCVLDYDRQTYDFFSTRYSYGNARTFGHGLFPFPNLDLYDIVHRLKAKAEEPSADLGGEIQALREAWQLQKYYFDGAVGREAKDCRELVNQIVELLDLN